MTREAGVRDPQLAAWAGAAAHPLADVLACPAQARDLLSSAVEFHDCEPAGVVFRQHELSKGLYLVISGSYARSAERFERRLSLGTARAGQLVELAAALGDGRHTYTLTTLSAGSLALLPMETLYQAFAIHPPLRMHLLEELAREMSRAYAACCVSRSNSGPRRVVRQGL